MTEKQQDYIENLLDKIRHRMEWERFHKRYIDIVTLEEASQLIEDLKEFLEEDD